MAVKTFINAFRKECLLADHLIHNFYPLMHQATRKQILLKFSEYWKGKIDIETLAEDTDIALGDLYHQYNFFLNEEDLHE